MVKKDRDYIFYGITRSICPKCKRVIDAQLLIKDKQVYMKKSCKKHGSFIGLISSDAEMYSKSLTFNKPGTMPLRFATKAKKGCPYDCGLCEEHQQHTCVGVIEITDACNLKCPVCYANSNGKSFLTKKEIEDMLNTYMASEEHPQVVQFTGGEPTMHPQLLNFLKIANSKGIKMVMLNTNGLKIAEDEAFAAKLAKHNIVVYLQFDGFRAETYQALRGRDLVEVKYKALERLFQHDIPVILVPTIVKGVNDGEIGEIVKYAVKHKLVMGIVFQPVAFNGRMTNFNPMNRTTLPDVIKAIDFQTDGMFSATDFIPLPCPYPICCSLAYAYRRGKEIVPITRKVKIEDYLNYFKDQIIDGDKREVRKSLETLWSASASLGLRRVVHDFYSVCGIPKIKDIPRMRKNVFKIVVKPFMDAYTFDLQRAMKCCVHTIRPDGKFIPFCVNNVLHRKEGVNRHRV